MWDWSDVSEATKFIVAIGDVSGFGGGALRISLDGEEKLLKEFVDKVNPEKGGKVSETTVKYGAALTVMIPRNREADLVVENRLPEKVEAPLPAGAEVGQTVVLLDGVELGRVPLILAEELPKGNWWNRLMNKE